MADTAPITTYVPKQYSDKEKREFYRIRLLHKKKKERAKAATKA